MNKPLSVIFATICLDAIGIGLIFPVLPRLIEDVTQAPNAVPSIGVLMAIYGLLQFIFAPFLGALSDRIGRRPVLLLSLAGAAMNYVLMVCATSLTILIIGRAIAGITSANVSVATAYVTDVSSKETRSKQFGLLNAMFGIGFILGPVLGGILGDYWLRLPFAAAGVLNGCNLLIAFFILPESRMPDCEKITFVSPLSLASLRWLFSTRSLAQVVGLFFVLSVAGEVYGTCWALWGKDVFGWNGLSIGLSLAMFGVCQSLAQAFLSAPAVKLLGERRAVLTGIAAASLGLLVMAFIASDWMVYAMMPVVALSGIGTPALQSLATRLVNDKLQGQFQGTLASAMSIASIIGPLGFSSIYFLVRDQWPGAIWLSALALEGVAVLLVFKLQINASSPRPTQTPNP